MTFECTFMTTGMYKKLIHHVRIQSSIHFLTYGFSYLYLSIKKYKLRMGIHDNDFHICSSIIYEISYSREKNPKMTSNIKFSDNHKPFFPLSREKKLAS